MASLLDLLRADLDAFAPGDAVERAHLDRMRRLLANAGGRATRRDYFEPGHFTASAFVLSPDGRCVLLIRHTKLKRWLQPGGHIDAADASPLAAARRELREEAGVAEADVLGGLFDVDIHPIPANPRKGEPAHEHFDLRYLLRARSDQIAAANDALAARWVPAGELAGAEDASVARAAARLIEAAGRS